MTTKERKKLDRYYSKYGIDYKTYETILSEQNGKCALCDRAPRPGGRRMALDHNHETGTARGILCFYCNKYRVGKLNWHWAFRIMMYLGRFSG